MSLSREIEMTPHEFTLLMYNLSLFPIIFFSVLFLFLTLLRLFIGNDKKENHKKMKDIPFISVQIPAYNDPIAERCVKKCMEFDYPKDKYEIIIADDSTSPETGALLKRLSNENHGFVKYVHRNSREHFKPGALKNAMNVTKGDIIVIFDADWIPEKNFLKRIIEPFSDPKVALVQTKQGFYNKNTNLITRFAAYVLMIYHDIIMPINNRINCVFFCGTAGAIRRSAFEEAGGWNLNSITEDCDLSVNLLLRGYKSVYLDIETPSEVPATFEGFVKQQMRWCYGNTRVFFDNAFRILFGKGIALRQRAMIVYITLGNIIAPVVVLMTIFGFAGWFIGEPTLFSFSDVTNLMARGIYTAGFISMGFFTLCKKKQLSEFHYLVASAFTIGIIIAVANTIAFFKAAANSKLGWYCTPKSANDGLV